MYPEMLPFRGTGNKSGKEKNMRIRIDEKDRTMAGWLKAQKSKTASVRTLIRMASYVYGDRDVTKLGFDELLGRKNVVTYEKSEEKEIKKVENVMQEIPKVEEKEEGELSDMLNSLL